MVVITLTFLWLIYLAEAHVSDSSLSIFITRKHKGDVFTIQGEYSTGREFKNKISSEKILGEKYYKDLCMGISGGTAEPSDENEAECKCEQQHPVYRDDLNICVNDMQECTLVPFVTGTIIKKIPYVFLPLKGQIVFPSAEIVISENGTPVCVVSGGQFLGRNGWVNLRNNSDTEPPFRLFRDEGRTYLQWLGETSMRLAMEGRIILVHLLCKDPTLKEEPRIFTPCIAFRVAGNPSVREVIFATDVQLAAGKNAGLSLREYIAIGLCSLFLAIVYMGSIFLYLHWRKQKRKKNQKKKDENTHLTLGEEGIIKNNPLLQANRHFGVCGEDNAGYITDSNSYCSDPDRISDLLCLDEDDSVMHQNMQTSAIIHPCDLKYGETTLLQDPNSIERLPEENVSIVETFETKEVHPETIKAIASGNGRKKLYFNPLYFEPELLKVPPPAALEFLVKIREVITMAKLKMSNKKFSPSLLGIPEEEGSFKTEEYFEFENNTKRLEQKAPIFESHDENPNTEGTTLDEFCCTSDAKQKIIQKWLEDVPLAMNKSIEQYSVKEKPNVSFRGRDVEEYKTMLECDFWQTNEIISKTKSNKLQKANESATVTNVEEKKRPLFKTGTLLTSLQENVNPSSEKCKKINFKSEKEKMTQLIKKELNAKLGVSDQISGSDRESRVCHDKNIVLKTERSSSELPNSQPQSSPTTRKHLMNLQENNVQSSKFTKNLMDTVIQELTSLKKTERIKTSYAHEELQKRRIQCIQQLSGNADDENETVKPDENIIADIKNDIPEEFETQDEKVNNYKKCNENNSLKYFEELPESTKGNETQDEHDYEIILLNGESQVPEKENSKAINNEYNVSGVLSKCEKNEGYSLVSEIYVSDGNSSGGRNRETYLNSSSMSAMTSKEISCQVLDERTSRLTIHVKDFSKQSKDAANESEGFEPDTLERKQGKSKPIQKIETLGNTMDANDKYSNQRFHDLDCCKKITNPESNENFTDSLERPTILLKTNGSFKKNSLEKDVNELFRNLNWTRIENFGSLREIYEAKSRNHRRRTETTSLIDSVKSDTDCVSTLSWGEERRNKLLHRGIVLHIGNAKSDHTRSKHWQNKLSPKQHEKFSLRTQKSEFKVSTSLTPFANSNSDAVNSNSLLPPSGSASSSPQLNRFQSRSKIPSPQLNLIENCKNSRNSAFTPFSSTNDQRNSATMVRVNTKAQFDAQDQSVSSPIRIPPSPPRPPRTMSLSSPPLPPRKTKPPLPPKNSKIIRPKSESNLFATRPLPPIPFSQIKSNSYSPIASIRDFETLSNASGASMDSLNLSEYESFYMMPYEEEEIYRENDRLEKDAKNFNYLNGSGNDLLDSVTVSQGGAQEKTNSFNYSARGQIRDLHKKILKKRTKHTMQKVEDSGYLSTDSSETYCPQIFLPSQISRIPEGVESFGGQNSETEESICDGASESGAESTATDSFFYGNFNKTEAGTVQNKSPNSTMFTYSLRLSDVEVNSDTERHSVPIMVRP